MKVLVTCEYEEYNELEHMAYPAQGKRSVHWMIWSRAHICKKIISSTQWASGRTQFTGSTGV
jgi:hypothetical protein